MFKIELRLVQLRDNNYSRRVGVMSDDGNVLHLLEDTESTYELSIAAIRSNLRLEDIVSRKLDNSHQKIDYETVISENRLLPPLDHPDPAHCLVTGTGLDHLGSALARDAMHLKDNGTNLTDSMKMFRLGLERGKPKEGKTGVSPEWFYKGDGTCIVPPGHPLDLPSFALDGGEEAEIVGLYVVSELGEVFRVGFSLGNEYSDHLLEKENYLYLAHSKLRDCSIGPELLLGPLPDSINGEIKLMRGGKTIWSSSFITGEANMTHSISNIEYHHFKYKRFRRPGDVHCHFLGASIFSFSAGVTTRPGDAFEIFSPTFGRPLRNPIEKNKESTNCSIVIRSL